MTAAVVVYAHLAAALTAAVLGLWNLAAIKGTPRHKLVGRSWIAAMLAVTLPSFWIRELNPGGLSWIHGLTAFTLASLALALWGIRTGRVRLHANAMIGTMIGLVIAGGGCPDARAYDQSDDRLRLGTGGRDRTWRPGPDRGIPETRG